MLYQVLLEAKNLPGEERNKQLFEFDKTEKSRILDELIIPYLKKEDLQFDGYFINAADVVRIVIKTTKIPVKDIADFENSQDSPLFFMYTTKEMVVLGEQNTENITKDIFKEAREILTLQNATKEKTETTHIDKDKVFIVHGHDDAVKLSVARFLEKLKLSPVILHEQASGGATIIEKIEQYSNVGFGIVLYTPCDLGKAKNHSELNFRARQNVIFEHGYLIGKLGRTNVCALVKDDVEKPNDISGVVYINYDSENGWQSQVFKELKNSGYDIDANLLFLQD